ncbi:MAG TPA: hypothetical protein VI197_19595, partial [Polyangiaceae bacterium]
TEGWLTQDDAAPYSELSEEQIEGDEFELDHVLPNSGTDLSADRAGALYNYLIIARGSAFGVHNPIYTQQLIYDSYVALTGEEPETLERP